MNFFRIPLIYISLGIVLWVVSCFFDDSDKKHFIIIKKLLLTAFCGCIFMTLYSLGDGFFKNISAASPFRSYFIIYVIEVIISLCISDYFKNYTFSYFCGAMLAFILFWYVLLHIGYGVDLFILFIIASLIWYVVGGILYFLGFVCELLICACLLLFLVGFLGLLPYICNIL